MHNQIIRGNYEVAVNYAVWSVKLFKKTSIISPTSSPKQPGNYGQKKISTLERLVVNRGNNPSLYTKLYAYLVEFV